MRPERTDPQSIGTVIEEAVVIARRNGLTLAMEDLRRRLARQLLRELRQEGRLTPDA